MRNLKNWGSTILMLIVIITLSNTVNAQSINVEPDQRITDVYGTTYTNNLKTNSPERIDYLNFLLDNSYTIVERESFVGEKMPKVSSVSLNTKHTGPITRPAFDVNNFNMLLYNFKRNRKIKTQYRVDNTNKVIVFNSEEENAKAFNQTK